jgi:hypothetical protein
MKFYSAEGKYFATLGQASRFARLEAKANRRDVEVHMVEVSTKRDNVLRMLNTEGGDTVFVDVVYIANGKRQRGAA